MKSGDHAEVGEVIASVDGMRRAKYSPANGWRSIFCSAWEE